MQRIKKSDHRKADFKAKELYEQFRKIYQKAKEQYEATPTDKRGVVVIK